MVLGFDTGFDTTSPYVSINNIIAQMAMDCWPPSTNNPKQSYRIIKHLNSKAKCKAATWALSYDCKNFDSCCITSSARLINSILKSINTCSVNYRLHAVKTTTATQTIGTSAVFELRDTATAANNCNKNLINSNYGFIHSYDLPYEWIYCVISFIQEQGLNFTNR